MPIQTYELLYYITKLFQIGIYIVGAYFFIISIFGWVRKTELDVQKYTPAKSFAVVIAAHNEEVVIGHIIDSLLQQNYPPDLYDILVIADNCTDKTSSIAKRHGALVFERVNLDERGKGYALEWMFNKIFKMDSRYDAVCVLDADNLVSGNFLLEMNKQLLRGYKAVQGYVDSKNPFDSWITCSYSISFWLANRLFQLSRYNLGLTCGLCGTGFCIDMDILKKIGWGATCLTEDLEFTIKLSLNDVKIGWCHDAIVYDEKPLTLKQSWKQRKRWMQGHADCALRYFPSLIAKAIKQKNIIAFDCAIYLCQPIRFIFLGLATLMIWVELILPSVSIFSIKHVLPAFAWNVLFVSQIIYAPTVIAIEKKFNIRVVLGFLIYPFYCLTWVPIAIQGILARNNKTWNHTLHTREISIKDLEKAG